MGGIIAVAIGMAFVAIVLKLVARAEANPRPMRIPQAETFPTAAPALPREPAVRSPIAAPVAAPLAPCAEPGRAAPPADDETAAMIAAMTGPGLCTPVGPAR